MKLSQLRARAGSGRDARYRALRSTSEGQLHPAVLRSLKDDLAAGEHRQCDLARTYCVSKQRVSRLARRRQPCGPAC